MPTHIYLLRRFKVMVVNDLTSGYTVNMTILVLINSGLTTMIMKLSAKKIQMSHRNNHHGSVANKVLEKAIRCLIVAAFKRIIR